MLQKRLVDFRQPFENGLVGRNLSPQPTKARTTKTLISTSRLLRRIFEPPSADSELEVANCDLKMENSAASHE
jgi:hypothetical protein